jgi:predicted permease
VLTFRVSFQAAKYDDHPDARGQFIAALADRLRALPGVAAASAVSLPPVDGCCSLYSAYVEGFPTERGHAPMITGMIITPGYFRTMGIHLVAGRDFNDADTRSAPPVTVINERFARTYWPGGNALGHHVNTGAGNAAIVGIVNDIKQDGLLQAPEPQFYRPYAEDPWTTMTMTVRVQRGDPMRLVPDIRRIMRTLDPAVPIFNVATMRAIVDRRTVSSRVFGELLTVFACIALILAATGVYATMAFAVAQRTRELGLRLALGAAPTRLTSLVLRQSLLMALAGGTIGLASGTFAARALAHTLYGVDATEPWGYATAAAVLLVAAIAASYGPARRASAVDPMVALRAE